MASDTSAVLYVGIKRSVVALDATTGVKRWSAELPATPLFTGFVTVHVDGGHVYAATAGEIFCLDAATGAVVWQNALEGYGIGYATLATQAGSAAPTTTANDVSAAASATADAAAVAAAGGIAAAL